VSAAEQGTAFVPWIGTGLADMLCVQEERVVANDNTVRYQGKSLQIPPDRHRFHYVKVTVWVHEDPDGMLAVFHGPRCLARNDAEGQLREPTRLPSVVTARPKDRPPSRSSRSGQLCAN